MTTKPPQVRVGRGLLPLMVILSVLGMSGIASGLNELSSSAYAPVPTSPASDPAVAQAQDASRRALVDVLGSMPLRRPLAVINAVVSLLLLSSSFLLMTRRPSAPWWISQAAIANGLWTIADMGSQITQLLRSRQDLARVLDNELRATAVSHGSEQNMPEWFGGGALVWSFVVLFAAYGMLRVGIYVWIFFRSRRPDLKDLLEPSV